MPRLALFCPLHFFLDIELQLPFGLPSYSRTDLHRATRRKKQLILHESSSKTNYTVDVVKSIQWIHEKKRDILIILSKSSVMLKLVTSFQQELKLGVWVLSLCNGDFSFSAGTPPWSLSWGPFLLYITRRWNKKGDGIKTTDDFKRYSDYKFHFCLNYVICANALCAVTITLQ